MCVCVCVCVVCVCQLCDARARARSCHTVGAYPTFQSPPPEEGMQLFCLQLQAELLTVEVFCLHLSVGAFLLTIRAFGGIPNST